MQRDHQDTLGASIFSSLNNVTLKLCSVHTFYTLSQSAIADGEAVSIEPELGGHELVLSRLALMYSGPDQQNAAKAFRLADKDNSGFLDFRELCSVVKAS